MTVYFPTGWYKTNKTLIIPPRVTIKGDGGKHTTIRYTGDRYDNAGIRKTSGYTDSITIGGTAYTLARDHVGS